MPLASLELGLGVWLLLVAVGGLLALDAAAWPQAMLSRPIVSGTIGGLFMGDPGAGFLVGAVLEVASFRHPPFGAARYPDTGPAGLCAGAAFAAAGTGLPSLLVAVLAGWAIGWAGSHSVHLLREANGWLVGDPTVLAARTAALERRHRLAMGLEALRGSLITAALLVPVLLAARLAAGLPPPGAARLGWAIGLTGLGLAALAGAGARNLGPGRRGWPLLLAGAAVGVVLLR